MSVARVHYVEKAAKDQGKCGRCGVELPKGSAYLWFSVGFRSHSKSKRCRKPECAPRASERESSLLASVYAAQEDNALPHDPEDDTSTLSDALQAVADAAREVAEQYEEAESAFESGNSQMEERKDALNEYADELEGWQAPGESRPDDGCEDHEEQTEGCEKCADAVTEWWQEQVDSAQEALDGLSL